MADFGQSDTVIGPGAVFEQKEDSVQILEKPLAPGQSDTLIGPGVGYQQLHPDVVIIEQPAPTHSVERAQADANSHRRTEVILKIMALLDAYSVSLTPGEHAHDDLWINRGRAWVTGQ